MSTNPYSVALETLLADLCTPQVVRNAQQGKPAETLAQALQQSGFADLMLDESQGGANATWAEVGEVVHIMGKAALPLPLAHTIVARRWLHDSGLAVPGWLTMHGPPLACQGGQRVAKFVPFGHEATHVLAVLNKEICLLPCAAGSSVNLGAPEDFIQGWSWPKSVATQAVAGPALRLQSIAALLQAGLLTGAMERVLDMTLEHAATRQQFGQPIARFQAIQHLISEMAEHYAAATMATAAAFHVPSSQEPSPLSCAIAKARTSEAAALISRHAHAIHGAIGMTAEHDLQIYTRRLHSGRWLEGPESYWHTWIGQELCRSQDSSVTEFVFRLSNPAPPATAASAA